MQIESEKRLIDANLNRLREGIRVIEDIARYILNDLPLASRLKTLRHRVRINNANLVDLLLQNRDIQNDILKKSSSSEMKRENLRDIAMANFKRTQESARVLEEIFKLDSAKNFMVDLCESSDEIFAKSSGESNAHCCAESSVNGKICEIFKAIRYELYDIEIAYFRAMENI